MLERAACRVQAWRCDNPLLPGSLLPFLYHTNTIQQRPYTRISRGVRTSRPDDSGERYGNTRSSPRTSYQRTERQPYAARDRRREDYRRAEPDDAFSTNSCDARQQESPPRKTPALFYDVPFENAVDDTAAGPDCDNSTITPREKKVFETLLGLSKGTDTSTRAEASNTKAKPNRKLGLDTILDSAMQNIKPRESPPPKFPAALRPMAEEAREKQRRLAKLSETDSDKDKAIKKDLHRVNALLDKAPTDIDLWNTLTSHVLNRVAALALDTPPTPYQQAAANAWQTTHARTPQTSLFSLNTARLNLSDLEILTANLPNHLLHYMHLSTTLLPSSLLPLNLLPTLKKLGPAAFALGTTTPLYNAHISLLHTKYPTQPHLILSTLAEMDAQVYSFDEETLELVDRILKELNKYRHGHAGPGLQALFATAGIRKGIARLMVWRDVMLERREGEALRRVREAAEV